MLETLLGGVGAVAWELDLNTQTITYVNSAAEEMLGYPREEWLDGPGFLDRVVIGDPIWKNPVALSDLAVGNPLEWRLRASDGRLVCVRVQLQRFHRFGSDSGALRALMLHVTEERESARKMADVVRRSALAAAIGATVSTSDSLERMLQSAVESIVEHLGAVFARVWTANQKAGMLELRASAGIYTHLDGEHSRIPIGKYKIGMIAEERLPHLTNDVQNDVRVSDKRWAEEEGMVAFAGYPLLLGERLLGVLAMFSREELPEESLGALHLVADRLALVIDQKQAQEQLQERESQLAEAQAIAGLGSWEWEVDQESVTWSDELYRVFGLEPGTETPTLESFLARVHPEDRDLVRSTLETAALGGGEFSFEHRIIRQDGELRSLQSRGRARHRDSGTVVRLVGTSQDITGQKAAAEREVELAREQTLRVVAEEEEKRSRLLSEAGRHLSSSLDFDKTLRSLARMVVPDIADWCAIDIVGDDGQPHRVVTAHPDPEKEKLAADLELKYPAPADAAHGVRQVLRTGEAELVSSIAPEVLKDSAYDAEHLRILQALKLRSYMVVPLTARGRILGAITLIYAESDRRYDPSDLAFARELSSRAAYAVDNARLYREAERARSQTSRILESITDAFFSVDQEWRFAYVNDQAEKLLGRGRDDLMGRSVWEELPLAVGDSLRGNLEAAANQNQTVQFEEYHRPTGAWLEVRVYPSPDGLSIYLQNITDRKSAEAAILEREERFRFLADSIPQHVWITRPDGYHEYYNQRWYDYTGISVETTEGEGWARVLHPEDEDRALGRWQHSLATGERYSIEYRCRRHDGEYRWFLGQAMPQRGSHGEIVRWFGTLTDIEDQKAGERDRDRLIGELDLERSRLQQIFREAPAFIATLRGSNHVFESANPPYLQLVGHRDLVGKPVVEALPEVAEQGFLDLLDGVFTSGEPFRGNEVAVMLQGEAEGDFEQRILNFVYQPILDVNGDTTGIFVHGVDVTEQVIARRLIEEKAEELLRITCELELSNRELDQFAYVASHDLKAPLRGIANLSQWIEEDFGREVSDEAREHLELLRGRVHRMEGLIDGILQYSRAGRVKELPEQVNVADVLEEVLDLLAPPEEVEIRIVNEMPVLELERLPIQQVFLNLIGNAIKYSEPDARVTVSASDAGEFHEFVVADNGPGIASEFHDRIFGIFQTLQARDRVEGTGIGLSLVRKIVDTRGGRVWVESEAGAGAAFHFLWPKHHQPELERG
ncbi:hypothetical protein BH23GEM6_BH23GEM6_01170 [soil metagenome]